MNTLDRKAAAGLRTAERPDVRALRSAIDKVERNFNDVLALQDEEIRRLRVIVLATVRTYRAMAAVSWRGNPAKARKFTEAMDVICLESDAIEYADDLPPKQRPAKQRG